MGLAGAADEDDVVGGVGEAVVGEAFDQRTIDGCAFEGETGQVAMLGEAGRGELVAHRTHGTVGLFGLHEVYDRKRPPSTLRFTLTQLTSIDAAVAPRCPCPGSLAVG